MRAGLGFLGSAALVFAASLTSAEAGRATSDPSQVADGTILGETADGRMPRKLSDFGFFPRIGKADLSTLAPGVRNYRLRVPLFSDGADKMRQLYLPADARLQANGEGLPGFPVGSALIKTFAFGMGDERQLIETRVLLHRADGWIALPYRWNAEQDDARLALAGARIELIHADGEPLNYRIPNANQCKACHSKDGEIIPIGPKARNLGPAQLASFGLATHLDTAIFPDWDERTASEDSGDLARAYLDVNCAHCHQPGGAASNSGLDLRWEQDDPHALGIDKPPVAAGRGSGGRAVSIAPGAPEASIIVHRMRSTEPGVAMPELGRSTPDDEGIAVVARWIASLERKR